MLMHKGLVDFQAYVLTGTGEDAIHYMQRKMPPNDIIVNLIRLFHVRHHSLEIPPLVPSCLVKIHIKKNCTIYEYTKRNWVRRFFCDRATVCVILFPPGPEESGKRTYLRERS